MSITLTVTAKGQITLRKEVLRHLGVRPGDRLESTCWGSGACSSDRSGDLASGRLRHAREAGGSASLDRGDERGRRFRMGRRAVRITADTNVLVRTIVQDDEARPRPLRRCCCRRRSSRSRFRFSVKSRGSSGAGMAMAPMRSPRRYGRSSGSTRSSPMRRRRRRVSRPCARVGISRTGPSPARGNGWAVRFSRASIGARSPC